MTTLDLSPHRNVALGTTAFSKWVLEGATVIFLNNVDWMGSPTKVKFIRNVN